MGQVNQNWLVEVNIANKKSNYDYIMQEGERLLMADDFDLKIMIKRNCSFHDTIEWDKVSADELREDIATLQRGE